MEPKNKNYSAGLVFNAVFNTLPVSLIGTIVFTTVDFIVNIVPQFSQAGDMIEFNSGGNVFASVFLFFIFIGFTVFFFLGRLIFIAFLASFLVSLAGVGIAAIVFYGLKKGFMTVRKSFYMGISVGSLVTLVYCVLLNNLNNYYESVSQLGGRPTPWPIFVFETTVAVGIAAVCGGLSAVKIYRNLLQKM